MGAIRSRARAATIVGCVLLLAGASSIATGKIEQLDAGDLAWNSRARVLDGRLADPRAIEEAIRSYRSTHERSPDPEVLWKLMRALHFLIEFTNATEKRKSEALEEALRLAESAKTLRESEATPTAPRAYLYFWSAIVWGARGQSAGVLQIVREGIANRLRDYAERVIELEPGTEEGGAFRLLSRLHATLPKIPFVSGWVDRDQALPLAERSFAISPGHPGNQLVLALALLEGAPERRDEAVDMLRRVSRIEPRSHAVAEELAIRDEARAALRNL